MNVIFALLLLVAGIFLRKQAKKRKMALEKTPKAEKANNHYNNDGEDSSEWLWLPKALRIASTALFVISALVIIFSSLIVVSSGTVRTKRLFGKVQRGYVPDGLQPVNPFANYEDMNIQRNAIRVEDDSNDSMHGMKATTADNIQTLVEANFAFMVNPDYAWYIRKYIGDIEKVKEELLQKAAQSATRDALAHFQLEESQISRRTDFEQLLAVDFKKSIVANLPREEGLTQAQLEQVFIILPTQLMNIIPDAKVSNALSEKKANEINYQQQTILTKIATEIANRRAQEGKGINKLLTELPQGYSADDVAKIVNATANKERADALMKAITDGKANVIVMDGGSSPSINIK
jgi:hypothetical protein